MHTSSTALNCSTCSVSWHEIGQDCFLAATERTRPIPSAGCVSVQCPSIVAGVVTSQPVAGDVHGVDGDSPAKCWQPVAVLQLPAALPMKDDHIFLVVTAQSSAVLPGAAGVRTESVPPTQPVQSAFRAPPPLHDGAVLDVPVQKAASHWQTVLASVVTQALASWYGTAGSLVQDPLPLVTEQPAEVKLHPS